MKIIILAAVLSSLLLNEVSAAEYGLDPGTRDESIAGTRIEVTTSREGDVWLYQYVLEAPETNAGTVQFFRIRLECPEVVDDRGFDPSVYRTKEYRDLSHGDGAIPAAITADYGATWAYSITANNEAMFAVKIPPGESKGVLKIYSPYAPGKQHFILQPHFPITEKWDYSGVTEEDEDVPMEEDFHVNGLVTAPSCPANEEDPQPVLFDGSLPRWESEESMT